MSNPTTLPDATDTTERLREATLRVLTNVMVLAYQRHRSDVSTAITHLRDLYFLSCNNQAALAVVLREALELLDEVQA